MPDKPTVTEIVNLILEENLDDMYEDEEVIHILLEKTVAKNVNHKNKDTYTFGNRVADKLAKVAGSWAFIIVFCSILLLWIFTNAALLTKPYDPYPFILLNLMLSCVAALQAPVIMMSQNRQEQKDRIRAENDYKVNLKSELIIRDLHAKLDQMIANQELILARTENGKSDT